MIGRRWPESSARVLHVHPHGAVVRAPGDAGNLATTRAHQKAPNLRVTGSAQSSWLVPMACMAGWSSSKSVSIHSRPAASNARPSGEEAVAVDGTDQIGRHRVALGVPRPAALAGEQKDLPLKARGGRITAVFLPAQDLPVQVVGARLARSAVVSHRGRRCWSGSRRPRDCAGAPPPIRVGPSASPGAVSGSAGVSSTSA